MARQSLRESMEGGGLQDPALWKAALDLASEAVLLGDGRGRIRYANRAAELLLGWEAGGLEDQPIHALIPSGLRGNHDRGFRRYQQTGVPRVLGRAIRVPVLRRNGTEVRLELTLSPVPEQQLFIASLRPPRGSAGSGEDAALGRVLQALLSAAEALTAPSSPGDLPRIIAEVLGARFGASLSRVWQYDADSGFLRQPGRTRRRTDLTDPLKTDLNLADDPSIVAEVGRTGAAYVRNDLSTEPELDPDWVQRFRLESAAILPMTSGGRLQGVLGYFSTEPISGELVQVLEALARMAAAASVEAERRELQSRLERRERSSSALADLLVCLDAAGLEEALAAALELARTETGAHQACLMLLQGGEWEVEGCSGYGSPINGYRFPASHGVLGRVLNSSRPEAEPAYFTSPDALPPLRQRGVRSVLAVPIRGAGAVVGVLHLEWKQPVSAFSEDAVRAAETVAAALGLAPALRQRCGC